MIKDKKMLSFYLILLGAASIIMIYALFNSKYNDNFELNNVKMIDCDFELDKGDGEFNKIDKAIKMPSHFDTNSYTYRIRYTLDESYPDDYCLALLVYKQFAKIYVEDECVAIYDYVDYLFKSPQKQYLFVDIKEEYFGKDVIIEYTTPYADTVGRFNGIYIGNNGDITMHLIKKGFIPLLCSIWMFGLGIFLIVLWIIIRFKKRDDRLLYMGMFSILMALWTANESPTVEILGRDSLAKRIAIYEVLLLISIPITLYNRENSKTKIVKIIYNIAIIMMIVAWAIANVLFLFDIKDFTETVYFMFFSMIIAFVVPLCSNLFTSNIKLEYNPQNFYIDELHITAKIILGGTSIIDIANNYFKWYGDNCLFSRFGFVFYITLVVVDNVKMLYNMMIIGQKAEMFKEVAHQDSLTKAYSRMAYVESMDSIDIYNNKKVCIVSFDVNDLKKMNDVYGHEAGDKYIVDCVNIIKEAFCTLGKCYRTGGDEFVVIIKNFNNKLYSDKIAYMHRLIERYHKENDRTISISYGHAVYEPSIDTNLYDTAKRADALMYELKRKMKEQKLSTQ